MINQASDKTKKGMTMADKPQIAEKQVQNFQNLTKTLSIEGYRQENAIVSALKANVMAFVTAGPFMMLFGILFHILHGEVEPPGYSIILLWLVSIPVHELLHGISWFLFCKNRWKRSIHFGIMWSALAPYCHCSEVLSIWQYYIGLLMPFWILGILVSAASIVVGSQFWLYIGIFNILLAGGDMAIACVLFKFIGKKVQVLDHPSECGCAVFVKS